MGEYAIRRSDGERIKIGTCEQMYYLRADQIAQVKAGDSHDTDPERFKFDGIRFRFPFPDEDNVKPGEFEDFDRVFRVDGVPMDVEHYSVQFKADNGYLVSLPCPEGLPYTETGPCPGNALKGFGIDANGNAATEWDARIGRNGYGGSFGIHSQRFMREDEDGPERLVTVCRCKGCGALWRLHTWADAEPVVVALRSQADEYQRRDEAGLPVYGWGAATLHAMADRIAEGYGMREVASV
jgi:hypothetical protein